MKSFFKFLAIVLAIVLLSSLLAPWLFTFLPFKFERILHRLIMIFTLLAIVLFVRVKKENLMGFGLERRADSLSLFLKTFFLGMSAIVLFSVLKLFLHDAEWSLQRPGLVGWALELTKITLGALIIGLLEEFFFRGYVFNTLKKKSGSLLLSILMTSTIYSLIHFVGEHKILIGPNPTFFDSLKLIGAPFLTFFEWRTLWPQALGLFIFGLILNDLVVRTKSLYASIGLHAGCVYAVKLDGMLLNHINRHPLYLGTEKVLDGFLGWGLLFVLFLLLRWYPFQKYRVPNFNL
ncbi:MAG: CPBP family intramembrane metalloprotease [Candidatus Omnitrophica bacterium]|nr:CPBP family intramembrane metalloprotease [Candidatus Omnitrophota bacterium]